MDFIADKIVFTPLKNMKLGFIDVTNYNGQKFYLGNKNSLKRASLIIKKKGFTLEIISKGSVGLAESYMRGDFDTDNLTNLIEILADNIGAVHKFAGIMDAPLINILKIFFLKIQKKEAKKIFQNTTILVMNFFHFGLTKP